MLKYDLKPDLKFDQAGLFRHLNECDDSALDQLEFGVVALAPDGSVTAYNACEQRMAGLSRERVVGKNFFEDVAPCTNNFMVAQRFQDEASLDAVVPYVFTLRMRPTKVKLRLLKEAGAARMYLLVQRA